MFERKGAKIRIEHKVHKGTKARREEKRINMDGHDGQDGKRRRLDFRFRGNVAGVGKIRGRYTY